ncbi:MAG: HAD family hydrolase [Promethearchaeota archaeon]|jgi:phosphoglycolate phosphatase-like HAD superfamily hydrolase
MKYDIFIFDLDGTLLNLGNIGAYADQILIETLRFLNIPKVPEENIRKRFWSSGDGYIELLKRWGISEPERFWSSYDKIDFKKRKILIDNKDLVLFNDVKRVLEKILNCENGKKLALVTNTADFVLDFIMDKFDLAQYFHETFSLGTKIDEKHAKPSPSGINSILKRLKYDSRTHKAIMIGDSIVDVVAAKRANIKSCLIIRNQERFKQHYHNTKIQPDYIIKNLDEILKL